MIAVLGRGRVADALVAMLETLGQSHRRVDRPEDLAPDRLTDVRVLVDAAGQLDTERRLALRRAGIDVTDPRPDQARLRASLDLTSEPRTITADERRLGRDLPGVGLQHLVGECLAELAAEATGETREVHVTYTFPDHRGPLGGASDGRRRLAAAQLGEPMQVVVEGALVEEPLGEARRLGWFPRPVGPRHAAAIPGGEPLSVPRRWPQVDTVRTYVAVPGWRAELLQATGNLARWGPARRRIRRRLAVRRTADGRGADRRWACVAEASGRDGVARAWAYGRSPEILTGVALALVAVRLADEHETDAPSSDTRLPGGERRSAPTLTPVELASPRRLLDDLARHTDLRWSLARPTQDD